MVKLADGKYVTLVAEWFPWGDDQATGCFCADFGELEGVAVQGHRG